VRLFSILAREASLLGEHDDSEDKPDFERTRRIRAARKEHPCAYCPGGWIRVGQPYVELVTIDGGRFRRDTFCCGRSDPAWPCNGRD
jgi:hypothetical protein